MRETVVVFVKLPEVPVMVTVADPTAAVLLAVSVSVLVLVALPGLNEAVTPAGKPEADKLTLPLKPFCGVIVMVFVTLAPCVSDRVLSDAESEKLGWGGPGVVRETLSKEAVARAAVVRSVTARPMYTLGAMLTVWVAPSCIHFTPSEEPNVVNALPLRLSLIQPGGVIVPTDW